MPPPPNTELLLLLDSAGQCFIMSMMVGGQKTTLTAQYIIDAVITASGCILEKLLNSLFNLDSTTHFKKTSSECKENSLCLNGIEEKPRLQSKPELRHVGRSFNSKSLREM